MLEIIINKDVNKKIIMLVENGILVEKHEEHYNRQRLEGNIYCGKVQNVLEGMQSAFVDIGDKRNTSIDSRYDIIGAVSNENVIGKVVISVWPLNKMGIVK